MKTNLVPLCAKYNFEALFKRKGYTFFNNGLYNLNIIGVRHKGDILSDLFDDVMVVIYNNGKQVVTNIYNITTHPGIISMKQPENIKGAAILVPGQYRGCWKIGLHKGKYKALCQCKPIKVYRDNDKDNQYDLNPKTIDNGIFGINIHKAGESSTIVSNWSAGCQVFANKSDFDSFMKLCNEQVNRGIGETFTYTLLTEEDLTTYE